MNAFWSPLIERLSPYVPGEQLAVDQLIKLNTNENPYPPSAHAVEAIRAALGVDGEPLRLYPEPTSLTVRQAAAKYWNLLPDQVFAGNGSDEVLAFVFQGLLSRGRLGFPDISYSFYPSYCRLYGMEAEVFALNDGFEIDLPAVPKDLDSVIFPNPNAPTGKALQREWIERFLTERPSTLVVVDEAYVDFGAQSCVPLIDRFANLVVTQSLSKSRALAGMRVGLAFAQAGLIEALVRVKDSFNSYPIDRLAAAAAVASIEDRDWFESNRKAIIADRDWLTGALQYLGFEVLPSQANFVFVHHPGHAAKGLAQALRERKILVRHFEKPRISEWLRITVGTRPQCEALVAALSGITGITDMTGMSGANQAAPAR
ncbi:MAG: histidinol-phosphate transaminase [Betaproteobacteria bacterium]|nr:histidinol-phosphate transaminase [Betaproteobacteria bacterium]